MHPSPSPSLQTNSREDDRPAKRRKVRKGTQSCWECKKRKVRCIWASPTTSTCNNCVRRKSKCVSQEFTDELNRDRRGDDGLETRLSRVENLLERLIESTTDRQHDIAAECMGAMISERSGSTIDHTSNTDITSSTSPETTSTPTGLSKQLEPARIDLYISLSRDLIAAWPSASDLDYICRLPVSISTHVHMKLTTSSANLMKQVPDNPRNILQLPPPGSHPILIARKLLLLSNLVQGALSDDRIPTSQQAHFSAVMFHAMDVATRLVTSNDSLTASVEGVECIMIESIIQNYAGNLHRAWLTVRRAVAVAQMLGLHHGSAKLATIKVVDPKTREGLDPDQLCCRIVEMDRYLSLTLGLPQSSLQTVGLSAETIAKCHPLDRIARLQCVIGDRILARRVGEPREITEKRVREIDNMFKEVTTLMPSDWWLIRDFDGKDGSDSDPMHETVRNMYQLSHFYLIIRLHLPYVLRSPGRGMCEESKATAVHAAREIMSRYIAFRKRKSGLYYCRGVDYLAFVALTVLCLAHIDSQNQSRMRHRALFDHSRPSDRALMEYTVKILGEMRGDDIATKLSGIMQYLLDAEAASANGTGYSTSASETDDGLATEFDGQFIGVERAVLQLHIPYFGTISLQRKLAPDIPLDEEMLSTQVADQTQAAVTDWNNQWSFLDSSNDVGTFDDWTLQSINEGLFGGLLGGLGDVDFDPGPSVDM